MCCAGMTGVYWAPIRPPGPQLTHLRGPERSGGTEPVPSNPCQFCAPSFVARALWRASQQDNNPPDPQHLHFGVGPLRSALYL